MSFISLLHLSKSITTVSVDILVRTILFYVVVYSGVTHCTAQIIGDVGPKQPLYIRHADVYEVKDEDTYELSGNVIIEQGNVTVTCDKAVQYQSANKAVVTGNVKIVQGSITMLMPRGEYDGNNDIAVGEGGVTVIDRKQTLTARTGTYSTKTAIVDFRGDVKVEDDSVRIFAQRIVYDKRTQESNAFTSVLIQTKFMNSWMIGDSARNIPSRQYSVIRGRPHLFQIDTLSNKTDSIKNVLPLKNDSLFAIHHDSTHQSATNLRSEQVTFDTLAIIADSMESFRAPEERRTIAYSNVEIIRRTIRAVSSLALYDMKQESMTLTGKPYIWVDSMQLKADSLWFSTPQKKLRAIHAHSQALLTIGDTIDTKRTQQIAGSSMYISIEKDTLRYIRSIDSARSIYFLSNGQGSDGVSQATCDSLVILFEKGQLENIHWLSSVRSEYYPESLTHKTLENFTLEGFERRDIRPELPKSRTGLLKSNKSVKSPLKQNVTK